MGTLGINFCAGGVLNADTHKVAATRSSAKGLIAGRAGLSCFEVALIQKKWDLCAAVSSRLVRGGHTLYM